MSYDGKIMRRALARFSEDKQRRQNQADQRRRALFAQEPRLAEIDRELRGTMSRIISSALRRGTDPVPAIRVIRDDNLSLQRERRELLEKLGYPADYLEERPRCPLCGDTGYRDGRVCSCLQSYYAREQIQELSRMLDVGSQSFETFRLDYYSPDRGQSQPLPARDDGAPPRRLPPLCRPFRPGGRQSPALRRAGAGEDVPLGLHRARRERGRLFRCV